jgi:hypothetical protein
MTRKPVNSETSSPQASQPFIVVKSPKPARDQISQMELRALEAILDAVEEMRRKMIARVRAGASVEPGPLRIAGPSRVVKPPSA